MQNGFVNLRRIKLHASTCRVMMGLRKTSVLDVDDNCTAKHSQLLVAVELHWVASRRKARTGARKGIVNKLHASTATGGAAHLAVGEML